MLELIEGLRMYLKHNQRITFLARALGLPWAYTSPLPVCVCVRERECARAARARPQRAMASPFFGAPNKGEGIRRYALGGRRS